MALKENYKDDILDVSQNVKRKYQMENNGDGTVSFTDVTEYTQQGDSFGASDMNATNGKVNTLESDIGEINDNLSGFKFYPIGTNLVALISDDSFYKDANGKYVIWGTATAEQLVEDNPNTYKSVPSTEDCRGEVGADTATPFSSLEDINADYSSSSIFITATEALQSIPILGYSKIGVYRPQGETSTSMQYKFVKKDGSSTSLTSITVSTTVQELSIPDDACWISITGQQNRNIYYGLKV